MSKSASISKEKEDRAPIIGINGMRWPDGGVEMFTWDKTQIHYIAAVQKAGGIPITLPCLEIFDIETMKRQMELIDGLLLQGGVDVNPSVYGEEEKPELGITDIQTDKFILELINIAKEKKMPILGICKGIQILNVAYGGTLYQDLKYAGLEGDSHKQDSTTICNHKHTVKVVPNSLLSKIIPDKDILYVNSYHHQAVKDLAKGFVIDAKSEDGIIEAMHLDDDKHWVFSVQWHPEQQVRISDDFMPLFTEFVKQAKIFRNSFKK